MRREGIMVAGEKQCRSEEVVRVMNGIESDRRELGWMVPNSGR